MLLDVKGAYDSVEHQLLLDIIKHCNLPPGIIRLTLRTLTNITTRVQVNSQLSHTVHFYRGLRQGCPSAPWQWNCVNSLFVNLMQRHLEPIDVKPIRFGAC